MKQLSFITQTRRKSTIIFAFIFAALQSCKKPQQVTPPPPLPEVKYVAVKVTNTTPDFGQVTPTDTSVQQGSSVTLKFSGPNRVMSIGIGTATKNIFGVNRYTIPSVRSDLNPTVIFSDTLTKAEYDLRTSYLKGLWVDTGDVKRFAGSSLSWQHMKMDPSDVGVTFGTTNGVYKQYNGPTPKAPDVPWALEYTGTCVLSYDGKHVITTVGGSSSTVDVVTLTAKNFVYIFPNANNGGFDIMCNAILK